MLGTLRQSRFIYSVELWTSVLGIIFSAFRSFLPAFVGFLAGKIIMAYLLVFALSIQAGSGSLVLVFHSGP